MKHQPQRMETHNGCGDAGVLRFTGIELSSDFGWSFSYS